MKKEYELATIQDIFDKVPVDRIRLCCEELGTLLATAKATTGFLDSVMDDLDINATSQFKSITWIDDGKGELKTTYSLNDDPMFQTVVTRK